jgi:TonB family protein
MVSPRPNKTGGLLKMSGVSSLLHIALVAFFSINPWPTIIKVQPTAYTVTLMPIPIPEPEIQKPTPPPVVKEEKPKPIEKPKKDDIVEKVKVKKTQKEKVERKDIEEALEEFRKKVAIDEIKKRLARREKTEEQTPVVSPPAPIVPSPKTKTPPISEPNLDTSYGSLVKLKIKEAWTIPENLIKEMVDLETIIVIIIDRDGRVEKWWFEKKSGNAIYDQSTVRAIIKAEPLPPIPKELRKENIECQIRFRPDY